MGVGLTPDTLVPLMLQSESVWKHIEVIYHINDEDRESRCARGAQQRGRTVKIALGPAPAVARLGRAGLPRRCGEESLCSRCWRGAEFAERTHGRGGGSRANG